MLSNDHNQLAFFFFFFSISCNMTRWHRICFDFYRSTRKRAPRFNPISVEKCDSLVAFSFNPLARTKASESDSKKLFDRFTHRWCELIWWEFAFNQNQAEVSVGVGPFPLGMSHKARGNRTPRVTHLIKSPSRAPFLQQPSTEGTLKQF